MYSNKWPKRQDRQGSATIMGITLMIFLTIILGGLAPLVSNQVRQTTLTEHTISAQTAAEAGVKRAIVGFSQANSANWSWLKQDCSLANAADVQYNVVIQQQKTDGSGKFADYNPADPIPAGVYLITSTGRTGTGLKQSSRTISALITRSSIPGAEYGNTVQWLSRN